MSDSPRRDERDLEPLIEPEPELSELDRRLRQRERRMPWVRLAVLAAALLGLLIFYDQISEGMSGCFGKYIDADKRAGSAAPTDDAQNEPPSINIEPARPLHTP
jgi:hypothetical protein